MMDTRQCLQGRENQRELMSYLPSFFGLVGRELLACDVYCVTLYFCHIRVRAVLWNRNYLFRFRLRLCKSFGSGSGCKPYLAQFVHYLVFLMLEISLLPRMLASNFLISLLFDCFYSILCRIRS
jgi:hypothetical protein